MHAGCVPADVDGGGVGGCYHWEGDGGTRGRWPEAAPPLAHFVGAPDKLQLMKYTGMWNYDAGATHKRTV